MKTLLVAAACLLGVAPSQADATHRTNPGRAPASFRTHPGVGYEKRVRFPRRGRRPVRVAPCGCREHWRPGHFEIVCRTVWVPGVALVKNPPRCGRNGRTLIRAREVRRVVRPGRYHVVPEKRWVPGTYVRDRRCRHV